MNPIKLVISDIDGTLITSDEHMSDATRQEIRRVMEKGVHFGIASGRPTHGIREVIEELDLVVPIIGSNGAVVEDINTGEIIHSTRMQHQVLERIRELIQTQDVHGIYFDTSKGWLRQLGRSEAAGVGGQGLRADRDFELITDLDESSIVYKVVVHGEEPELERFERVIEGIEGVQVTSSWSGNREIIVAGADKANAAKRLAEHLQIDRQHVLAVGDNRNDLELIEWAGIGVAMGNAIPELKELADWVTTSNDADGVAHALARFIP